MANYVEKSHLYQWNVTGLDGHHTCASNGLQVQHTCKIQHLLKWILCLFAVVFSFLS